MHQRTLTIGILILSVTFLASCTKGLYKIGYQNGDTFIKQRLNVFFELTSSQENFVEEEYDKFLKWHRRYHLPLYRSVLVKLSQKIQNGSIDKSYLKALSNQMDQIRLDLWNYFIPVMTKFMVGLAPEQRERYIGHLGNQTKEFNEYVVKPKNERFNERFEKTIEFTKQITGDLNKSQRGLIQASLDSIPDPKLIWLNFRETRNAKLVKLLRGNSSSAEYTRFFQSSYAGSPRPTEEFKKFRRNYDQVFDKYEVMYLDLLKSLTSDQTKAASAKLREWSDLVDALR